MFEKVADKLGHLLKTSQTAQCCRLQLIRSHHGSAANSVRFHVGPHLLSRIELGRVRRHSKDAQFTFKRRDMFLHFPRPMHWMAIPNQKNRPLRFVHEAAEKLTDLLSCYGAFHDHKPKRSPQADGADHVQAEPRAGCANHRGLAPQRPSLPRMKIRPHARLIFKINRGLTGLGLSFNARKFFLLPTLYRLSVLLIGAIKRPLAAKAQLPEQAPNGTLTEPNPELLLDRLGHNAPRPQRKGEVQLPRVTAAHRLVDPADMPRAESLGAPTGLAAVQCLPSTGTVAGQPVVNTGPRKAQSLYDYFRAFTFLHALNGPGPNLLQCLRIQFSSIMLFHA